MLRVQFNIDICRWSMIYVSKMSSSTKFRIDDDDDADDVQLLMNGDNLFSTIFSDRLTE